MARLATKKSIEFITMCVYYDPYLLFMAFGWSVTKNGRVLRMSQRVAVEYKLQ